MTSLLQSFNPATGDVLGQVAITPASVMPEIIANAKRAAQSWRRLTTSERVRLVQAAFAPVIDRAEELATLLAQEMGKDLRRAMSEVTGTAYAADYTAQEAGAALATRTLNATTRLQYQPLGVAAVISPWNYPLAMAGNLIVPALVAGNTVVFKPSEETPLIAQALVDILNQTLPAHVLQIVHGNEEAGKALVNSDINLIAFTGSVAAGKDIMASASSGLKRLVMELGGNDPMIVMNNANIETAAHFAVASSLENTGQMCTSTERIYVASEVADAFIERVVQLAARYKAGPWNEPGVKLGPLVNQRQHRHVMHHLQDAIGRGARLRLGSVEQAPPYISPAVITNITPDMLIEQEETFGPVIAIGTVKGLDEAIARANQSPYGLGAVVFGGEGAEQVAEQLEAGMVAINSGVGGTGDSPWVGAKHSGYGFHGSPDGHRQFAQVRVLSRRR
ncbi:aldehyde dehydrogenase [Oceanimonas sp. MB9]|uniref:aldehyde dehydrogenase family protein n=1 Tax=Oceanimonas sp. MB9 TaxID=2588453 RepID=UPI0013F64312|nr:aldehyde dehydrogenase family protein [Oceanimonas sp. MB9]NHI00264.1 Succinate-semialdehyde dehydrogenase [NADP(+)] [Oceanimonas sp. MB9]